MANAVLECIKTRRSIRRFKPGQITEEETRLLLEAAAWAPSGGNNQSWLFTAIRSPELLARLNETLRRTFLTWTPDDDYSSKRKAKINAEKENFNYFYHAPTLVVASNLPDYQNAMADCSCAMQNLFLAAHSLGLGTCWINQPRWLRDEPAVRDVLAEAGIPREHVICSAAAVGYPDQNPPAPARKKGTGVIVD